MKKSLIIIGKGYSITRCTKEYVDSNDEVCIINSPVYDGYEHLLSNHADFMFTNKTGLIYPISRINSLGLKKMLFTGQSIQRFIRTHSSVESIYPKPNLYEDILSKEQFKASSGMQALTYFIENYDYSKISLVGFDFYQVGTPPYYFNVDQVNNDMKYLWNGDWKDNIIRIPSGHEEGKSIDYMSKLILNNENIDFEIISNNKIVNELELKNLTIIK